jgi:hypothetical protein
MWLNAQPVYRCQSNCADFLERRLAWIMHRSLVRLFVPRVQFSGTNAGRRWLILRGRAMLNHQREIYHSENGDRWFLCRDDDSRVFVSHQANVSSGGTTTKIEIGDFLGRGKAGPEHQALVRLIGDLVDSDPASGFDRRGLSDLGYIGRADDLAR